MAVDRIVFLLALIACLGRVQPARAEDLVDPAKMLFYPPADAARWEAWSEALHAWRTDSRSELAADGALYARPEFVWARRDFACALVMLWDELLWDPQAGQFTPERLIADSRERFGGFDSVVLWHAYPRIGLDGRNQFDFYRDVPGGLDGLRDLCRRFHALGVRCYIDYNPWDVGTRREDRDDLEVLAELVRAVEADGIFLDTLHRGDTRFRGLLDAARPGVVLESELALPLADVAAHHLSWGQWGDEIRADGPPGVARNVWFERRHMHHLISRWSADHTAELHAAWMNGVGMMVWENVFGQPRIWSARDRSILRAMLPVQRQFTDVFVEGTWTPLMPTGQEGVYATLWERGGLRLWTLVNRTQEAVEGPLLRVAGRKGDRYFDLIAGRELPEAGEGQGEVVLAGQIGPRGVGALLAAAPEASVSGLDALLAQQATRAAEDDFDPATADLPQSQRPVKKTRLYAANEIPDGMIAIPATRFAMRVEFTARECGAYQTPLERTEELGPFAIDATPVTNAEFARFLAKSGYRPAHPENFLKHWADGSPPAGQEDHPVVYVDLNDARAYAAWAGKRLPTEAEWQLAAGGAQGLAWPWGEDFGANEEGSRQRPNLREGGGTTAVRAYPEGRSPYGVWDACGNVWQWTVSERSDGRTRFAVIKGGSHFRAEGSHWYFDGDPRSTRHAAKLLLFWPGLDRFSTVGFRCVADLAPE